MKRALVALVAVAALAIGTSSALADPTPPPPGNTSGQSATLGQSANSTAASVNGGAEGSANSVAVSGNNAGISQFAGQAADDGNNASWQSADVQQNAGAVAVASNQAEGGFGGHANAVAVAGNNAFVDQDAFQLALWGTSNSSSQTVWGSQEAGAVAVAENTATCGGCANAFALAFNNGWVNQLAIQLAFP